MEDKIDLLTAIKRLKEMKEEIENRNMTSNEYDNLQAISFSLNYLEKSLEDIRKNKINNNCGKENDSMEQSDPGLLKELLDSPRVENLSIDYKRVGNVEIGKVEAMLKERLR